MNILLINPPARSKIHEPIVVPPLGLAYVAAVLEAAGHRVEILDGFGLGLSWGAFEDEVKTRRPDLVGLTGMTPVIDTAWRALETVRRHHPEVHVVLGGAHAAAAPEGLARDWPAGLDFAVNGEGEYIMRDLVAALENGDDVSDHPGLILRGRVNPPAPAIENLDELPLPARHLLPNARYRYALMRHAPVTTAFSSRGCPYPCTFCDKSVFGSGWRVRSPQRVVDEMEESINRYGARSLIFYDDLFTLRKKHVVGVCQEIIERRIRIEWKCEARVSTVDPETLDWMKRAGCTLIAFGVESANRAGLDYLRKGATPDDARETFKLTRRAGIRTLAYFLLGIPVETYDDTLRTIRFAREIRADYAQFSVLSPFPGTAIYDWAVQEGVYREIDAGNPVDKDLKRPAIVSENWTEEKLEKIVREAHRQFYLRPSYIAQSLLRMRSWDELVQVARLGGRVARWCLRRA